MDIQEALLRLELRERALLEPEFEELRIYYTELGCGIKHAEEYKIEIVRLQQKLDDLVNELIHYAKGGLPE